MRAILSYAMSVVNIPRADTATPALKSTISENISCRLVVYMEAASVYEKPNTGGGAIMKKPKIVCETPLYKVVLVHEANIPIAHRSIRSPEDAAKIISDYLQGADREHFIGLYLNSANYVIGIHTISVGILNSSLVHPREVFKLAYMMNAVSIIIAHNHPSGNSEPSSEDITMTKQLVEAGKILGIPLHDHIIVTEHNGYVSFAERGLL